MFPLHDRTRRQLCRAIFLLLGLLPATVAVAWSVKLHSSAYLAEIQANIATVTGLEVHLGSVAHPQPGRTRLEDIQLLDPASGQVVASARQVESIGETNAHAWAVIQPEINASLAGSLWTIFEKQCRMGGDAVATKWRLKADEFSLRWAGSEQAFVDGSAQFETGEGQQLFTAEFQSPTGSKGKPIQLRCQRNTMAEKTTTRFYYSTVGTPAVSLFEDPQKSAVSSAAIDSGTALPCALVAAVLHRENHLGPQSTIGGTIRAEQLPEGWRSELACRIEHVDLNAAVSRQFPHHLSGTAELTIRRTIVNSGRWEQCDAVLRSGPGTVSQSLLAAAQTMLSMRRPPYAANAAQSPPNEVTPIGELALAIKLDANGLLLRGLSGGETGVVIRAPDGSALLGDSAGSSVPVMALARTLVPDSRVQAPATQETEWLLQMLPMPQVMPRGN
ncbi:MAG TPA: hypothetical protein VGJ15_09565 [Pirellulales bacterium]|jgi:hypothetical protein